VNSESSLWGEEFRGRKKGCARKKMRNGWEIQKGRSKNGAGGAVGKQIAKRQSYSYESRKKGDP